MKSTLPFLSIALFFTSCTTAYKSGQTPDDVYFSPERPQEEYVRKESREEKYDRSNRYDEDAFRDDRYLRMKIRDRRYEGMYDDYYSYNPYYYHYVNGSLFYNSPWSSYSYWNYYYNPYHSHSVMGNNRTPIVRTPRTFDLSVYDPQATYTGRNSKGPRTSGSSYISRDYGSDNRDNNNYRGSGKNAGGFLREVFGGNDNSASKSNPSGSSGSSSGSSGSGQSSNAPTRKF